jgi:hypothetical protein
MIEVKLIDGSFAIDGKEIGKVDIPDLKSRKTMQTGMTDVPLIMISTVDKTKWDYIVFECNNSPIIKKLTSYGTTEPLYDSGTLVNVKGIPNRLKSYQFSLDDDKNITFLVFNRDTKKIETFFDIDKNLEISTSIITKTKSVLVFKNLIENKTVLLNYATGKVELTLDGIFYCKSFLGVIPKNQVENLSNLIIENLKSYVQIEDRNEKGFLLNAETMKKEFDGEEILASYAMYDTGDFADYVAETGDFFISGMTKSGNFCILHVPSEKIKIFETDYTEASLASTAMMKGNELLITITLNSSETLFDKNVEALNSDFKKIGVLIGKNILGKKFYISERDKDTIVYDYNLKEIAKINGTVISSSDFLRYEKFYDIHLLEGESVINAIMNRDLKILDKGRESVFNISTAGSFILFNQKDRTFEVCKIDDDSQLVKSDEKLDYNINILSFFETNIVDRKSLFDFMKAHIMYWNDELREDFVVKIFQWQSLTDREFRDACNILVVKPRRPKYKFQDKSYSKEEIRVVLHSGNFTDNLVSSKRNKLFNVWK